MKSAVTLQDVAELAGVSAKTVSRVINGDQAVTDKTTQRVKKAITALSYTPNPHARSLRTGRDQAIALVVDSISDPFFAALAEGVEEVAREAGLFLIVANAGDSATREREVVDSLLHRSISGLILVPCLLSYDASTSPFGPRGVPLVVVDRPLEDLNVDTVLVDNSESAQRAVAHLIAHGHRRIGFVGTTIERYTARERLAGYRAALEAADIAFDPSIVAVTPYKSPAERSHVEFLLSGPDPVTAIFVADARRSLDVVRILHQINRTDIAYVGFDDLVVAESLNPPLTVVRQDPLEIGRTAANTLVSRIRGDQRPPERLVLSTTLVVRGSGEIRPPIFRPLSTTQEKTA
ncbi:MAG: LacI family DNA-binding transcriptional regulator [Acidimicrobiaceae bacterium]|nr:LacI family DNA-binding transcriptional regulator [Acidimicrobiaceae bacterium]